MLKKVLLRKYYYKHLNFFLFFNRYFYYWKGLYCLFFNKLQNYKTSEFLNLKNFFFFYSERSIFYIFVLNFFNFFFYINFFSRYFFSRFMYFVSVGLGFKRKKRKKRGKKFVQLYIGNRHRIMSLSKNLYFILLKRSSFIFFSDTKKNIYLHLIRFRSAKKELAFKIKGFFFNRFKINKIIART